MASKSQKIVAKDIMSTKVVTATKDETVYSIAKKMHKGNFGAILITNSNKHVQGIVTERDIVFKVVVKNLDPKHVPVGEIMSSKLISGKPNMSDIELSMIFETHKVKKLPILKNKKLVGVVTQTDLTRMLVANWML